MGALKWALGALAGAAFLGCVPGQTDAQGQPGPAAVVPTSKAAAVVNGEEITTAELEAVLKRQPQEITPLPENKRLAIRRTALAGLIDDALRRQFLRKVSAPVAKTDIDKKMAEMSEMLKAQGKTLDDFYKDTGTSAEFLRNSIGYQLQWVAYCDSHVTDDVLQKYYDEYKDFFDGVMVEVSHIVLPVPPGASAADVDKARTQLTQLHKDIIANKIEFAQAAKQVSQCESAVRGGSIGFISRKGLDDAFSKAAFALPVGQVSDVVQTSFGLHLIKVTDRKPGTPSDFKAIKEKVRMLYTDDLDEAILMDLRKKAEIKIFE